MPSKSFRTSERKLFGIIGSIDQIREEKAWWNAEFERLKIDAFLDHYPTKENELPERLSEMFHFDRRGYIVGKPLQKAIIILLDHTDASVAEEGSVDTVLNRDGVLVGYYCGNNRSERWKLLVGDS